MKTLNRILLVSVLLITHYIFNLQSSSIEIFDFPESQDLYLVENFPGQYFNLISPEDYNFTSEAGSYADRSKVVFQDSSILASEEFYSDNILMYVNQSKHKLYIKILEVRVKQISMTNMLGQVVKTLNLVNNQILDNGIDISDLNSGIYIVSIKTVNNKKTDRKIFIN